MADWAYWAAGVFLPLFPLSILFNGLFQAVGNAALRALLLMAWPQIGLSLLPVEAAAPGWFLALALLTAGLYAFRALSQREVGQWVAYLGTSAWALLWVVALLGHADAAQLRLYALGFSVPLVMLILLGARLEALFGAAYTGLYGGLAQMLPRFSGVLVCVILAVVAVPVFPGFFAMLAAVVAAVPTQPFAALAVVAVWLLWSWAGARLMQGLIVGDPKGHDAADLSLPGTWAYAGALAALLFAGLYVAGGLP